MNEVLKYKSIGEMAQRSRIAGANYVRLEDYDNLKATYDNVISEIELLKSQAENDSETNATIRYERDHYLSQRDNACNAYTKSQINLSKAAELSLKAEARIMELEFLLKEALPWLNRYKDFHGTPEEVTLLARTIKGKLK